MEGCIKRAVGLGIASAMDRCVNHGEIHTEGRETWYGVQYKWLKSKAVG